MILLLLCAWASEAEDFLAQAHVAFEAHDLEQAESLYAAALDADVELIDALRGREEIRALKADLARRQKAGTTRFERWDTGEERAPKDCETVLRYFQRMVEWRDAFPEIGNSYDRILDACAGAHLDQSRDFLDVIGDPFQARQQAEAAIALGPAGAVLAKAQQALADAESRMMENGGIARAAELLTEDEGSGWEEAVARFEVQLRDNPDDVEAKQGLVDALRTGADVLIRQADALATVGIPIDALRLLGQAGALPIDDKAVAERIDSATTRGRTAAAEMYVSWSQERLGAGFTGDAYLYARMASALDRKLKAARDAEKAAKKAAEAATDVSLFIALPDKEDVDFTDIAEPLKKAIESRIEYNRKFKRWGVTVITDPKRASEADLLVLSKWLSVDHAQAEPGETKQLSAKFIAYKEEVPNPRWAHAQQEVARRKGDLASAANPTEKMGAQIGLAMAEGILNGMTPTIWKDRYDTHDYEVAWDWARIGGEVGFRMRSSLVAHDVGGFCPVAKLKWEDKIVTEPVVIEADPSVHRPHQVLEPVHASTVPPDLDRRMDAAMNVLAAQTAGNLEFHLESHGDRFWTMANEVPVLFQPNFLVMVEVAKKRLSSPRMATKWAQEELFELTGYDWKKDAVVLDRVPPSPSAEEVATAREQIKQQLSRDLGTDFLCREATMDMEQLLADNPPDGEFFALHLNGRIAARGEVLASNPVGPWSFWHENGEQRAVGSFDAEGRRQGGWHSFHDNGKRAEKGDYNEGDKQDAWTSWYPHGQKETKREYVSGVLEGKVTNWWGNGKKKSEGFHKQDERDGTWTHWWDNGNKSGAGSYDLGARQGMWTDWYSNGKKESKGEWRGDDHVGDWQEWHDNGKKRLQGTYDSEMRRQGLFQGWHQNGKQSFQATYVNHVKHGDFTSWYDHGKPESKGAYVADMKDGRWMEWHNSKKKKSKGSWEKGVQIGKWMTWDSRGKLSSKGSYELGQQKGKWIETDGGRKRKNWY
jgi:antitoxin component YwqK of YwqJK toxin-antitoxin module